MSQLGQVINAALSEYLSEPQTYRDLYRTYLGLDPRFIPEPSGAKWVEMEAGPLANVLGAGVLRFGYVEGPPYVFHGDSNKELNGLDWELGNRLTDIIRCHYSGKVSGKGLRAEWISIPNTEEGDPEQTKFNVLHAALKAGQVDVAMSGQANISSDPTVPKVDWSTPTELLFTNILYTGLSDTNLSALVNGTRDQFIDTVKKWQLIKMMCVVNLGPSRTNTLQLVADIRAAGGTVDLKDDCTVDEITEAVEKQLIHFSVGDSVASAWQGVQPHFPGLNLNITAALDPLGTAQPVAIFTLL